MTDAREEFERLTFMAKRDALIMTDKSQRDDAAAAVRFLQRYVEPQTAAGAGPVGEGVAARAGIYVASKTRHAPMWKGYRERGWPINSTWIDEAGVGESSDLNDLWRRCVAEASSARVLVVYREADDVLKGGWVEVGAALASGVPVYAVGLEGFSIAYDKRIRHFETLDDAMEAVDREEAVLAPRPVDEPGEVERLKAALHEIIDDERPCILVDRIRAALAGGAQEAGK